MSSDNKTGWRKRRLIECMSAIIDYRGKTPKKTDFGIPLVTAKVIKNGFIETPSEFIAADEYESWMRRGLPQAGDVVLTSEAPLGEVADIEDPKVALAQRVFTLRANPEILNQKFLKYLLMCPETQEQLQARSSGTTVHGIRQSELKEVLLEIPPMPYQVAMAERLGGLERKLRLNREMTHTLEEMSQALFKSWFVDFDPVVAKSEGRKPFGMSDDIAALFPDSFEESELGAVPKGWKTSAASDLLSILSGGTPKTSTSEYWDGAIPWFSVVDTPAPGEVFVLDTEKKITELGVQKSAATIYPAGTTIITARGTVGNVAMMGRPMAFNQSCYGLQGKEYFDGAYTYFLAKHIVEELKLIAHGSVFDTITRDSFDSIKVCKPPCTVVERFSAAVVLMLEKIKATVKESRTLQAMRNALLPQLLSGEIALEKEMTTQVTEPTAA